MSFNCNEDFNLTLSIHSFTKISFWKGVAKVKGYCFVFIFGKCDHSQNLTLSYPFSTDISTIKSCVHQSHHIKSCVHISHHSNLVFINYLFYSFDQRQRFFLQSSWILQEFCMASISWCLQLTESSPNLKIKKFI